jgi:UDP-N-acetyl-D-glucosamine dehydrogenase
LEQQGARVSYHDPHVAAFSEDGHEYRSVALTPGAVESADCVLVVTDHSAIDFHLVKRHARIAVDTRHVLPRGD